jgi:hypothetical protein
LLQADPCERSTDCLRLDEMQRFMPMIYNRFAIDFSWRMFLMSS